MPAGVGYDTTQPVNQPVVGGRAIGDPVQRSAPTKRASPSPQQVPQPVAPPTGGIQQGPTPVPPPVGGVSAQPVPGGFALPGIGGTLGGVGGQGPPRVPPGTLGGVGGQGGLGFWRPGGGLTLGTMNQSPVGREAIDPTQRGERLTFNPNIPNVDRITADQLGGLGGLPADVVAGQQGEVPGLDFGGFAINPEDFAQGGRFGIDLQGVGGGFQVNPQSVMDQAMAAFQSQLPGLNLDLADATEGLAKRTSALGRTGSGLFNRDTDDLSDRARATREGLLGNLSFQGATTDAANDLQAQIATGGFQQQGLDRLLQGRQFGAGGALEAALGGARLNQAGQQFDIGNQINRDQFNIGNALQAALANQQTGLAGRGQDVSARGQDLQRLLANQDASRFDVANALGIARDQLGLAERQQGREDRLATEAQNDLYRQLGLLQGGFGGDPSNALFNLAGVLQGGGQEFGANAGQIAQHFGGLGGAIGSILGGLDGGIPAPPPALPTPTLDYTGTYLG